MGLKVTVVGGQDPELDTALRACGATPITVPIAELAALAQPKAKQPELVVLDLRSHVGVPPGLAALKRQHPATSVIIVAKSLEPELILSAMRAGANECLAEPLTQGELDAAIIRVVARQTGPATSQAFAIVGAKGGVGATSLAVNVATSLARVATAGSLLIDLHVARGEAALYLGAEPRFSFVDALDNIQKLDEAFLRLLVVRAPSSRLELLASPETVAGRLDQARVRTLLEFTSKLFEFTVVDVPRSEPGALDALDAMKSIVVVTTQELASVRSAAAMVNRLRQRYGKERLLVVLNAKENQSDIAKEDIEQVVGAKVTHTIPCESRAASMDALNKGRPIVLDNHNSLSLALEKFARSLAGLKVDKLEAPASAGWLGRLAGRR